MKTVILFCYNFLTYIIFHFSLAPPFFHFPSPPTSSPFSLLSFPPHYTLWDGVRLCLLGTVASSRPVVQASEERWVWSSCLSENWQGKRSTQRKSTTVSLCPWQMLNDFLWDQTWLPWREAGKWLPELWNIISSPFLFFLPFLFLALSPLFWPAQLCVQNLQGLYTSKTTWLTKEASGFPQNKKLRLQWHIAL